VRHRGEEIGLDAVRLLEPRALGLALRRLSRSAASAWRRRTNWPMSAPSAANMSSCARSGAGRARVRYSIAPSTTPSASSGNANAPCSPAATASGMRGKFGSLTTSSIHAGAASAQTRPGSPSPRASAVRQLASMNASAWMPGACQYWRQRMRSISSSTSQSAPTSQPSAVPTAGSSRAAASSTLRASASERATAYCASSFAAWSRRTRRSRMNATK
jgi:hypothetical protein